MKARPHDSKQAALFRAEIDSVLETDFIEWDRVYGYVERLDSLLERINAYGERAPARALDAVMYFIEEIPEVFNNVHDECELEMFCADLAESAVALTKTARLPPGDTAGRLIDAYLADAEDTCRFDGVPDILAKGWRLKKDRESVAEAARSRVAGASAQEAETLRGLADKLSARRRAEAPRTPVGRRRA